MLVFSLVCLREEIATSLPAEAQWLDPGLTDRLENQIYVCGASVKLRCVHFAPVHSYDSNVGVRKQLNLEFVEEESGNTNFRF
jgi:hypothetical protein